ncbi:hypothetical protein TWF694_006430 [Orbilia ellipsospora]|uniref:Uncharacterized protein n=1 Tax=Orbilia ellipsospora TaxID=2528407 RepID=A0AAV9XK70_9PEZI
MDIRTARWHHSRIKHHFITSYLSKAKDKYKRRTPLTICTAFFLEEFMRSELTLETNIMLNDKEYNSDQVIVMPFKIQNMERSKNGDEDEGDEEDYGGRWNLYIIIRGQTMLSRFPAGRKNDGNLVIVSIGDRNTACEKAIIRLLYEKSRLSLPEDCSAYGYHIKNANEVHERYLLPSHTRYLDLIKPKEKRAIWKEIWKIIGVVEALIGEPTKTIADILKTNGETAVFEIPTSPI